MNRQIDLKPARVRRALCNAIDAQLDADLIDRVERHAVKRCIMLEHVGHWADPAELTQDAIEATLSGRRSWDPDRYSLYHHLCGVVTSRTDSMLKHARRFRHERMGAERGDDTDPVETAASLQAESASPEQVVLNADLVHRTMDALRDMARAKNDNQVLGVLDAYAVGITDRADVAARLGIGVRKYDHARERLLRLVARLDDVLHLEGGAKND